MDSAAVRPPLKLYDLEVTIISAKHLKNVNWKNGDLKPYAILWVDPERRQATKPDEYGSTRPVWNERFVFPLRLHPRESALTMEIYHSKPSEAPKPLVGTLWFEIRDLLSESYDSAGRIKTLQLTRPSGRPDGKIRLRLALLERIVENNQTPPPASYYYASSPAPPPHNYMGYVPYTPPPPPPSLSPPPQPYSYGGYSNPHSGYYAAYHSAPPPPRPFLERRGSYGGPGPSAPVDYTPHDYHNRSNGRPGVGVGVGGGVPVGTVAGAFGGLVLDEGIKHEEEKVYERVENDSVSTSRDVRYRVGDNRSEY